MATAVTRSYGAAQPQARADGLALTVLAAISEAISPAESAVLVEPLREVVASFVGATPGSLFPEWAPPRRPVEEDVPLHRAQAFASSCFKEDQTPASAALSADAECVWASNRDSEPKRWTMRLADPVSGPATVVVRLSSEHESVKPASVLVETSVDGFTFVPAAEATVLKDDEGEDSPADDSVDDDVFAALGRGGTSSDDDDDDEVRVALPAGRRALFLRVTTEGEAGKPDATDAVRHAIDRVRLVIPQASPLQPRSGFALDTILKACAVAGDEAAPPAAREVAVEAALAVAAAVGSPQAVSLALRMATVHLASGGRTLPGTVAASLRGLSVASAAAAAETRTVAGKSGAAPHLAEALMAVTAGGGDDGGLSPKFDTRFKGDNCTIDSSGHLWESTSGGNNYAMARSGIRRGTATWEFTIVRDNRDDEHGCVGFCVRPVSDASYTSSRDMWMVRCYNGCLYHGGSQSSVSNIHQDDVVRFKANMSRGTVHLWINGEPQNDGRPIFEDISGSTIYPAVCGYSSSVQIRFKSYSTSEGTSDAGGSVPVAVPGNSEFVSAVSGAAGVKAPGAVKDEDEEGAKLRPVTVAGAQRKDAVLFRPGAGDADDPSASAAAAAAGAASSADAPSLTVTAAGAISALKKKPPSGASPRLFSASFHAMPNDTVADTTAAPPTLVEVVGPDGAVLWRSPPLHTTKGDASAECRVPLPTPGAAATVTVTARACTGDAKPRTTVAMIAAGFVLGSTSVPLADVMAMPSLALDEVWSDELGPRVRPALSMGGGRDASGTVLPSVPTAQVIVEAVAAVQEAISAEHALTRAAVSVVGTAGRKARPAPSSDDEDTDAEAKAETQAALIAATTRLEGACALEVSDAALSQAADTLSAAAAAASGAGSGSGVGRVAAAVATAVASHAGAVLARISASGIRPAGLGISLPSAAARDAPISRLRSALEAIGDDASPLPAAAPAALGAVDAGISLFYPTSALRRDLLRSVLATGATLEVQVGFPTLKAGAIAAALGQAAAEKPSKAAKAIADRPAEAHPSMRDARFDRALLLLRSAAQSAGLPVRVTGTWGGWLHLLVGLPGCKGGDDAGVNFVSRTMAACLKQAGMGPWRFPTGCALPSIPLELHRAAAVPEADRRRRIEGGAVVRLFPAAVGSFDDVAAGAEAAAAAFAASIKA